MAMRGRKRRRQRNAPQKPDLEQTWIPKTQIGKKVKAHEITSIEEIYSSGRPILESEIVDYLLPTLEEETLQIKNTQRMTDCGRKMQFRAVVLVGDKNGHVGIGTGKSEEVRPAIETAAKNARRNIVCVPRGSGSWEDPKKMPHSIPIKVVGKNGSVEVVLKPAPRGVGLACNPVVKKVLIAAGMKNAWSFSRGYTRNIYNMAMATLSALESLNNMRYHGDWKEMGAITQETASKTVKDAVQAEASITSDNKSSNQIKKDNEETEKTQKKDE